MKLFAKALLFISIIVFVNSCGDLGKSRDNNLQYGVVNDDVYIEEHFDVSFHSNISLKKIEYIKDFLKKSKTSYLLKLYDYPRSCSSIGFDEDSIIANSDVFNDLEDLGIVVTSYYDSGNYCTNFDFSNTNQSGHYTAELQLKTH